MKIPDATTLIHINQYSTDKQNLEKKIGFVEKKYHILVVQRLEVTTTVLKFKIGKVGNKTPDNSIYITTQELNKLTVENFEAK